MGNSGDLAPKKEIVRTVKAPVPVAPYSQAVRVGNLLFCSGQGPIDPQTGQVVRGNTAEQARVTLNNLKAVIEAGGSSMGNVVKVTVYLSNIEDFAAFNEVYREFFSGSDLPARTAVQVARMWSDIAVEVEAIALVP